MNKSNQLEGDEDDGMDGPVDTQISGVGDSPDMKAQDASEPDIRKSNLSQSQQRKGYMKSPMGANKSHDKSGAVDKSEYEEGEYYDSEDSYGEQQEDNQNQNMPQPVSNMPQQNIQKQIKNPSSPYSGARADPQSEV